MLVCIGQIDCSIGRILKTIQQFRGGTGPFLLSIIELKISGSQIDSNLGEECSLNRVLYSDKISRTSPRVLSEGSMGLGESYMDGWWDCAKLDDFFYRILRAGLHDKSKPWIEVFRALTSFQQRKGK